MTDTYNAEYITQAVTQFQSSIIDPDGRQKLELRKEGEFSRYSLLDGVRLSGMIQSTPLGEDTTQLRDRIAAQCARGQTISFYQDGVRVGGMATITDAFNQSPSTDEFLLDNPIFYQMLLDVTTAHVLKNFTAPPKSTPGTAAPAQKG